MFKAIRKPEKRPFQYESADSKGVSSIGSFGWGKRAGKLLSH